MARLSLSPTFIKEVILLFRERSFKDILFGKRVTHSQAEYKLLTWIRKNEIAFRAKGGRKGKLQNVDLIHKGYGTVYVLPNTLGDATKESVILFDEGTKITQGPDLWVYLSSNTNVKKDGLGDHLQLVLLQGNRGGQTYVVKKPIAELSRYTSVVIWCKQFAVLFAWAPLS